MTSEQPYHRLYRWSPQPQAHYVRAGTKNPWIAELTGEEWNIAYLMLGEDIYDLEAPTGFLEALRGSMDCKVQLKHWGPNSLVTLRQAAWRPEIVMYLLARDGVWVGGPPPLAGLFPCWHFSKRLTSWTNCLHVNLMTARNDHPELLMRISDPGVDVSIYEAKKVLDKVKSRKRKISVRKK